MDVRCERCRTEYEFDDEKITEAGVTVRCTVCGHVFKVKKKALVVTEPLKPGEEPKPAAPDLPPAAPDKPREWRVRQASGNVFTFKELTTLQKWIVERKVARDDEISLSGESWKRLGNIAELASFFQVVEAADRANALAALAQQQGLAPQQLSLAPPPPSVPAPASRQAAPSAAWEGAPAPVEPVATREPAWSSKGGELDANELAAIKGSGKGKFVATALVLLAAAGGGLWFARRPASPPAGEAPAAAVAGQAGQPTPTAPVEPPAEAPAAAAVQAPAEADAGQVAAVGADAGQVAAVGADAGPADPVAQALPDAGEAPAPSEPAVQVAPDAGAPVAPPVVATAVPAVAAAPAGADPKPAKASGAIPDGKDFYWYIERALAQRERGNVEQALALYAKAEKLEPNSFEVSSGKGFCQLDKGNNDAAIALFQKALAKNPRFLDAIFGLAEGYKEKGDKAKAIEYYRKYLDSAPDGPEANLAKVTIERLSRE